MNERECEQYLIEGARKLDPVLNPLGYVFVLSGSGISSAGPFATGFYVSGEKRIGLICRSIAGLGAIIYENQEWNVSHGDLMQYLGKRDASKLKYNDSRFLSYSKGGGDAFDALAYDIENFGVEFLTASGDQFGSTLEEIIKASQARQNSTEKWILVGLILLAVVVCTLVIFFEQ